MTSVNRLRFVWVELEGSGGIWLCKQSVTSINKPEGLRLLLGHVRAALLGLPGLSGHCGLCPDRHGARPGGIMAPTLPPAQDWHILLSEMEQAYLFEHKYFWPMPSDGLRLLPPHGEGCQTVWNQCLAIKGSCWYLMSLRAFGRHRVLWQSFTCYPVRSSQAARLLRCPRWTAVGRPGAPPYGRVTWPAF